MKLIRRIFPAPASDPGCVATIGNFDGLHKGHQAVIQHVEWKAQALGLPATVISFEPLPIELFRSPPPPRIYALRDKLRLLNGMNVDRFVCLRFNRRLASMEAEDFVQHVLLDGLKVRYLVVGDDFRFGKGRCGDYRLLQQMGAEQGMQVVDTPTFLHDDERVSSTRIRLALSTGELELAAQLLGKPYRISGRVRHGDKRGRTLGFPTLNMRVPQHVALRRGVYAVQVYGLETHPVTGVANLGARPTVHGLENRLEAHLFGFDRQVYGQHICVEPVAFIRDEMKFASLDELKAQIAQDAAQARAGFQTAASTS
ncbi:bifunctional riboflavin kinase/FAD synthetase [Candidatus Thiothrix sp. Deng01]|uniref:Riboflavin biosynthesis protein n=1 Tax=Candidatus Thiothrix phosphatis TaxID=3112415 RepID=A0ABU6D2Z9_9GAMM|nr:bifunctional riboflavin kinase/FAD synthetase [Candidatus Thiothrix sp. Deng01]MEB4593428.1 bifunctional riboflavin kinase/FAD synthetase [Candidatus Thiothrix sp. Deng01]